MPEKPAHSKKFTFTALPSQTSEDLGSLQITSSVIRILLKYFSWYQRI
jgi:hypothetical protein